MAPRAIDLRSLPYVSKKSERTQQVVDEVLGSEGARRRRMFLVATSGPTSFVVKEAAPADEAAAEDAPAPAPASPRGDVPASPRLEESPLSRRFLFSSATPLESKMSGASSTPPPSDSNAPGFEYRRRE